MILCDSHKDLCKTLLKKEKTNKASFNVIIQVNNPYHKVNAQISQQHYSHD